MVTKSLIMRNGKVDLIYVSYTINIMSLAPINTIGLVMEEMQIKYRISIIFWNML